MIRAVFASLLAISSIVAAASAVHAETHDLGKGSLPIHVTPKAGFVASPNDQIRIEGEIDGNEPLVVVLRIDDATSHDYSSRINLERTLPPGPFQWVTPLKGLKTARGRAIAGDALKQIILFDSKREDRVHVSRFVIEKAPKLPVGAKGYSLGNKDAPLFAGFQRLAPGASELEAGRPIPILRPGVDPLIASGLRGLEKLRFAWPAGRARVSLWSEDVGEWETLPHPLQRRIRINGGSVLEERMSGREWIAKRYMRGRDAEAGEKPDPWQLYGRHRGGLISTIVDVGADGIVIELAGDSPAATYLSAVLIEPAEGRAALDHVENERANWFRAIWRVNENADADTLPIHDIDAAETARTLAFTAAAGSGGALRFALRAKALSAVTSLTLEWNDAAVARPDVLVWAAQERLERVATGGNLLAVARAHLHTDITALPLRPGRPRHYAMWIDIPAGMKPGNYPARIEVRTDNARAVTIPLVVHVPNVMLPAATKPAGYYLDEAPHLTWFREMTGARETQNSCDMAFLNRFGVTGNAPLLAAPFAERKNAFLADTLRALQNATRGPWLAYAPAKRLLAQLGIEGSAAAIRTAEEELRQMGLPAPVWSVADEPSNPGQDPSRLTAWIKALRTAVPGIKLAGHLNTPSTLR